MKRIVVGIIALIILHQAVRAQGVRLHGTAPDYSGFILNIETYSDFVTRSRRLMASFEVAPDGSFDIAFDVDGTQYAFIDLGSMVAHVYLEPGADYEIVLPPYVHRADADRFNPFFVPEHIELGIANADGANLNKSIRNFDESFDEIYNRHAISLVRRRDVAMADSLMAVLDSVAARNPCPDSAFFAQHVSYRKARLFMAPRMRRQAQVWQRYFASGPVLWTCPAYWDALDMLYSDFVADYTRSRRGRDLARCFGMADCTFDTLSAVLGADSLWARSEVRDVLLIKSLYNAKYTGTVASARADSLLLGAVATAADSTVRRFARSVCARINRLKPGTPAPDFSLYGIRDDRVSLADFAGRFVYLAFLHSDNFACRKDMTALSTLAKKYRKTMSVVGVMTDENFERFEAAFKKQKYAWTPLSFHAMQRVVTDYDVVALPAYFLVDPDGRLALSPAPAPTEDFEPILNDCMRRHRSDKLKRQPYRERNIYDIASGGGADK